MARELVGLTGANALLSVADVDLAYVEQIKAGNTEAFEPLWEKYERPLFQFFLKRVKDRQEAEDLVSDTLIAAWQSIPQFRGATLGSEDKTPVKNCTFRTYLSAIARHKLAQWIRRKRIRNEVRPEDLVLSPQGETNNERAESLLRSPDNPAFDPFESLLEADKKETVCHALASIKSHAQFKVVLLHYFAGLSHQEVATVLNTRSETINSRLQDGRNAFRLGYERFDRA